MVSYSMFLFPNLIRSFNKCFLQIKKTTTPKPFDYHVCLCLCVCMGLYARVSTPEFNMDDKSSLQGLN